MTEKPLHPIDALHEAIDGRLSGASRAALERHLAECASCRREFELLSALKRTLPGPAAEAPPVPADLEARVRRALDAEDRSAAPAPPAPTARHAWIAWAVAAAAVVVAALLWTTRDSTSAPAPEEVAADFRRYTAGALSLDTRTSDPAALEARLEDAGLGFPARVFDFGMMAYRLTGGGVHRVGGRPSALFAYEGDGTLRLLCQMYAGTLADLPAPAERRANDGIEFLVYRDGDVTLVFWQEGPVVCVLAANGDPEAAITLAFAKAVRV
jgi:anti-sigma factor RsiW